MKDKESSIGIESNRHEPSIIDSSTGNLFFDGDVTIVGDFIGKLTVRNRLIIESNSKAKGIIQAGDIILKGTISGNVTATNKVSMLTGSVLSGNLTAKEVIFHTGSFYNGELDVEQVRHMGISQESRSNKNDSFGVFN